MVVNTYSKIVSAISSYLATRNFNRSVNVKDPIKENLIQKNTYYQALFLENIGFISEYTKRPTAIKILLQYKSSFIYEIVGLFVLELGMLRAHNKQVKNIFLKKHELTKGYIDMLRQRKNIKVTKFFKRTMILLYLLKQDLIINSKMKIFISKFGQIN